MASKVYTKFNFHSHTFCIWSEVPMSEINQMRIHYTSQSGSQYIFTELGLYRISNHWGRVANCHWRLIPLTAFKSQSTTVAFAHWSDFYALDDTSKLFYIAVNFETKEVNFYHKHSANPSDTLVFRNAKETAKNIRIIKEVLTQEDWAKYLDYDDIEQLRKTVCTELVQTTKSFVAIKKAHLR